MNGRPSTQLWGKLAWHPAVVAWRALAHDSPDPERIEVLHRGEASATYRLIGAGPGGAPIIARRSRRARALLERVLYERILAPLALTATRYLGFKAESPQSAWLFLTDAGDG
ncbi:MAG TPA: hypothetical protein VM736_11760 [Gemmatimonadales bacterium]|nr:hypothetical protein [Gemmatimonadales bacterium]